MHDAIRSFASTTLLVAAGLLIPLAGDAQEVPKELRPLNPNYEILYLDRAHPGRIIGVMVEHRRYRR